MKILSIIGARPQFIKYYPFEKEAKDRFHLVTVHTGQHYDQNMSDIFFDQLGMSRPDYMLNLGGGNHGAQTGLMMIELEKIIQHESPSAVVVFGDTNSTLAGALVGAKLHFPVVHIEAGLRSNNKEMPEEINRILTDHISQLLLIPSEASRKNLEKEGLIQGVICVGDIMKDSLFESLKTISTMQTPCDGVPYCYATLHRPYNVDEKDRLEYVLNSLAKINKKVVFSIHPRTKNNINKYGINLTQYDNIEVIEPQSYFQNLNYLSNSTALITDSGGMQKEAYWLKKPCITIRKETEWTETLEGGANRLLYKDLSGLNDFVNLKGISFDDSLYGDGKASQVICDSIESYLKKNGYD